MAKKPKEGDLRVWHIPQVPCKPFHVAVKDIQQAMLVINTLAYYDLFQLENNIKPDFSNASGLEVYEKIDGKLQWCEWYDDASGNDIDEMIKEAEAE